VPGSGAGKTFWGWVEVTANIAVSGPPWLSNTNHDTTIFFLLVYHVSACLSCFSFLSVAFKELGDQMVCLSWVWCLIHHQVCALPCCILPLPRLSCRDTIPKSIFYPGDLGACYIFFTRLRCPFFPGTEGLAVGTRHVSYDECARLRRLDMYFLELETVNMCMHIRVNLATTTTCLYPSRVCVIHFNTRDVQLLVPSTE
jgi:hypothetical protein